MSTSSKTKEEHPRPAGQTTDERPQADPGPLGLMRDPSARKILVMGGPDTGKTTTLRLMLGASVVPVAFVDLDLGQSHVGPPAMLAWGWWRDGYELLEDIVPERLFFVGATSPLASSAGAISGAATVVSDAAEHADKVLIDTSGAVTGRFARRLKVEKVRALRPDVVVAQQREGELEQILADIERERLARVLRLSVPEAISAKSAKERAAYRRAKLAAYLEKAKEIRLSLDEVEVIRFGVAGETEDEYSGLVEGLLVGLIDRVGRHQGMGILRGADREHRELNVLAVVPPGSRIAALIPGRLLMTADGKERQLPK